MEHLRRRVTQCVKYFGRRLYFPSGEPQTNVATNMRCYYYYYFPVFLPSFARWLKTMLKTRTDAGTVIFDEGGPLKALNCRSIDKYITLHYQAIESMTIRVFKNLYSPLK